MRGEGMGQQASPKAFDAKPPTRHLHVVLLFGTKCARVLAGICECHRRRPRGRMTKLINATRWCLPKNMQVVQV